MFYAVVEGIYSYFIATWDAGFSSYYKRISVVLLEHFQVSRLRRINQATAVSPTPILGSSDRFVVKTRYRCLNGKGPSRYVLRIELLYYLVKAGR